MATPESSADEMLTSINVTPLVDITLVLLIVFMVTARIIAAQVIPVTPPTVASPSSAQDVFAITVSTTGDTTVASTPVHSDAELLALARSERAAHPDVRAVIHADAGARHGRVVHVMDLLHQAKIDKIAFGVVRGSPADE